MDDKAEAFAECLLGDIFGCFIEVMKLDIEFSTPQDDERFVPEQFYCEMISFSKIFIDELMPDMSGMPVLLLYSEQFFRQFTNSVCLKLIKNDDPDIAFVKVMAFLLVITAMSFVNKCYRSLDDLPTILHKLLKDHMETKFYEEERFDAILEQCAELRQDEKWYESTVEEMRSYMKESLSTELAKTNIPSNPFQQDRSKITLMDVRTGMVCSSSDNKYCPYCETECIFFLKVFWKPKIVYKPECQQM